MAQWVKDLVFVTAVGNGYSCGVDSLPSRELGPKKKKKSQELQNLKNLLYWLEIQKC